MARFNSVAPTLTATGAVTFGTPTAGLLTTLIGTAPYTVTLANPVLFDGQTQTFYNNTAGTITLATTAGNIVGPGTVNNSTVSMPAGSVFTLASNGSNYVLIDNNGAALSATTITASSTVTLSPSGANVAISPTSGGTVTISPAGTLTMNPGGNATLNPSGNLELNATGTVALSPTGALTINPGTASTINNCSIGATTRSTGAFTTLAANSTTTLVNTTVTPTQPPSATPTQDGHGFIVRAANYTGGNWDHRFVKPDMGGGIPMFIQQTEGTASTWTNKVRIGAYSGNTDTFYVYGSTGISGTMTATTIVETSSIVLKENINPLTNALETILKLEGKTYDRKDTKEHEVGLIAEAVYEVAPELVSLNEEGNPYGVKYTKVTAYLIEAIKTLTAEINELKKK